MCRIVSGWTACRPPMTMKIFVHFVHGKIGELRSPDRQERLRHEFAERSQFLVSCLFSVAAF